ncbi:carboxylate--amine ligase [Helcobacillus massiliensis]|uniref:D-aspartate ligase n=1 Tax=Helcobacillus massiliensis TaxID=521392 RepID=A0A839QXL3_9MICO|nr:carboxylate--amine ligase [Helcobacillus massiliensis]MBB3022711.1 D-aspartate ligase [Helcobacillus massiliensis]
MTRSSALPASPSPADHSDTEHVQLVLLGGDIGVYAIARAFHEAFGTHATVITRSVAGPVADSSILQARGLGAEAGEAELLEAALETGRLATAQRARTGGPKPFLLANADWLIALIVRNREALSEHYLLPVLPEDLLEQVADKAEFARLCAEVEMTTPTTVIVDFTDGALPAVPEVEHLGWPLVAKPSRSSAYAHVKFPGKRKVFEIADRAQLEDLVRRLHEAGFRDRFVLQEMIPGDDTAMRSVTAYVDQRGAVTLMGGAHVLLEEHTPGALGNPAAMITQDMPELFAQAERFLTHVGYRGYANFDVKVDPRDGQPKFFEVNPRVGRNNVYMTAAGANIALPAVADHLQQRSIEQIRPTREILYSIIPRTLLWRYVTDPSLRSRAKAIAKRATVHPLLYRPEGLKRRAYVAAAMANQVKKFAQHYRSPSADGF